MGARQKKLMMALLRYPIEYLLTKANQLDKEKLKQNVDCWKKKFCPSCQEKDALLWLFVTKKEFRNVFYYRINPKCLSQKVHWWCPQALESLSIYVDELGGGIMLHHPYSTIINAKSIGRNCIIRNNTTIGNKSENQNLRPVIGDNVTIEPNCVIIGPINIGDNVIIGAGSVVVKSIESNSVVAGNPAKLIRKINQ